MKTALILIVGNKYNRAIKVIDEIEPELVYFIHSKNYKKYKTEILKKSEQIFEARERIVRNFQSIDETYNVSKEIFEELVDENCDIKVAISNGTKAMISGLILASVAYDCELLYVGSDSNGRSEDGEVKYGHEVIISSFNPMKKQATLEISKGKLYFNKYQFDEAIENFKQAKKLLENKKIADIYINLSNLYKYWDKFDNNVIYTHPKRGKTTTKLNYYLENHILKLIEEDMEIKNYFMKKEKLFYDQLRCNAIFLNKKIIDRACSIDKTNVFFYLVDLMNNASRRIDERKYDDATARLYRASELIAQIRLLINFDLIHENKLKQNYVFHVDKRKLIKTENLKAISFIAKVSDFQDADKKTIRLSLNQDYYLLNFLGDDLARDFLEDDIQNVLSNRNNSILAHGLNPANREDTIKFLNSVEKYARENFIVDSSEFDKYYEYSKFPKFRDIEL